MARNRMGGALMISLFEIVVIVLLVIIPWAYVHRELDKLQKDLDELEDSIRRRTKI